MGKVGGLVLLVGHLALLSQVHNKLNNTHLALMHFSWAMDLDPKVGWR